MKEVWKTIKEGYGYFQISNYGRLKSVKRLVENNRHKGIFYLKKEKILTPFPDKDGYLIKQLSINKEKIGIKIHRLVAIYFISNPENLPQINHKNGIKIDNRVENLEWCTPKENQQHAMKTGLRNKECLHKLTKIQAEEIRALKGKIKQYEIAKKYNVSPMVVSRILNNKTYGQ